VHGRHALFTRSLPLPLPRAHGWPAGASPAAGVSSRSAACRRPSPVTPGAPRSRRASATAATAAGMEESQASGRSSAGRADTRARLSGLARSPSAHSLNAPTTTGPQSAAGPSAYVLQRPARGEVRCSIAVLVGVQRAHDAVPSAMARCHPASISEIGSSSQPLHDRGRELRAPACASSLVAPYRAAVTVGVGCA
jgi:hypothetical protein